MRGPPKAFAVTRVVVVRVFHFVSMPSVVVGMSTFGRDEFLLRLIHCGFVLRPLVGHFFGFKLRGRTEVIEGNGGFARPGDCEGPE